MKSNQKGNHLYAYKDTIRRLFLLTLFSFLIVESYAQNKCTDGKHNGQNRTNRVCGGVSFNLKIIIIRVEMRN